MDRVKILCVESHPEYMAKLRCMLEGIGCEVMAAANAGWAMELLANQPIDGVLLESDLSGVSGMAVRSQMKALKPDIPVLVFEGVGRQTPFMLRFVDVYLRRKERPEDVAEDPDFYH